MVPSGWISVMVITGKSGLRLASIDCMVSKAGDARRAPQIRMSGASVSSAVSSLSASLTCASCSGYSDSPSRLTSDSAVLTSSSKMRMCRFSPCVTADLAACLLLPAVNKAGLPASRSPTTIFSALAWKSEGLPIYWTPVPAPPLWAGAGCFLECSFAAAFNRLKSLDYFTEHGPVAWPYNKYGDKHALDNRQTRNRRGHPRH